jgi:rhodanese-related sulfurtransferase
MARKTLKQMLAEAAAEVETWSLVQAMEAHGDPNVVFVDVRDVREVWRDGTIAGALHAPRGMLEFWIDPDSPYAKPEFQRPDTRFVFFCATGEGARSGLAAQVAQQLGLAPVCRVTGGFKAWREAGGPVESRAPKRD